MLDIRVLQENEFAQFIDTLYAQEWIVEELYLQALYNEFREDFFIAYQDGDIVGFISAQRETNHFGLISNFIVLKEFRSLGFGKMLFSHALEHLGNRQIALECKKEQEVFYSNFDFKAYYDSVHYFYTIDKIFSKNEKVRSHFDAKLFSGSKTLISLIKNKKTIFRALYKNTLLSSYGLCIPYNDGYKVIISSESYKETLEIFHALLNTLKLNTKIYIEVTPLESHKINLISFFKMKEFSRMSRMYNKVLS